ncbi:MAG TPA: class I SAM-dependent methyltransferase [Thermomicrobiaceae bacterium]|nr:class I SAM-dependent methyltransferase [Thermomicrobiaceae bacterium]
MDDPKRVIADGYDRLAERYVAWAGGSVRDPARPRYLALLERELPRGASLLDLGCATGALVTARLAARFQVTGVDLSPRQIEIARAAIPNARFIHADMTEVRFPPASFEAVTAFYALNHLPRRELAPLLTSIAAWLRPSGLFVASLPAGDTPGEVEPDWLGVPMYFSGYDAETNTRLIEEAGLRIEQATVETIEEDGQPVEFLWVVARKGEDDRPPIALGAM